MIGLRWMVCTMLAISLSVTALAFAQPGITKTTIETLQDEGATSQPEQPSGIKVISTVEMKNHLTKVRKALEGARLEYSWTQYQGKGTMPENWMKVGDVHLANDKAILRYGEKYHEERLTTGGMTRYGYQIGVSSVQTWDGWLERSITHLPKEVAEERNGVRGTNQNPASITDTPWHSYSSDELDRFWQSIAVKLPRVITLADVLDHPSLTGPYLLDDGRTEWQVESPDEWSHGRPEKTKILLIGERTDTGIRLSEISHQFRRQDIRVERRYIFSEELFSKDIPIPLWARYVGMQSRVGNDPSWFNTEIVLKDAMRQQITDDTFTLTFPTGAAVFDGRYQMRYEVDDTVIGFPRRREGAILTNKPIDGDVGENLTTWLANGILEDPGSRDDLIPIGVDDLDLPADHKHDFGKVKNMNWGSGKYHVFKVTNNTDKSLTIKDVKTTGKPIRNVYIGYEKKPVDRNNPRTIPSDITGLGTTLKPGETVNMYVSFSFGGGLWRHGVTLITDTGEEWKYQLSATGIIEPKADTFVRLAPKPGTMQVPVGVRLFTGDPEDAPIIQCEPDGVKLEFDQWITLLPFRFVAGAPMRQIGRASLDFSDYEGEFPCTVRATTAKGVNLSWMIFGSGG